MLPSNFDFIDSLVEKYNSDINSASELHKLVSEQSDYIINYVFSASRYGLLYSEKETINKIRKTHWYTVFNNSNLENIISSLEKNKIVKSLESDDIPDFTRTNVETTLQSWASSAYSLFSEKVNSVFERLSNDHVTNQPHGFTKKIIFKNLVEYTWFPNTFNFYKFRDYGEEVIHDLRTSIQVLYNLPISSKYDTSLILKSINERNEYTSFDNGAFKIKVFKNGNAHIELNPHVAILLNCELAKLFPTAIPPKHRTSTPEIKEYTFDYTHISENAKNKLREFIMCGNVIKNNDSYKYITKRSIHLDDKCKEILEYLQIYHCADGSYESEYNIVENIRYVILNGICDYKSNQYYPTPKVIVDELVEYVGDTEGKKMLEPSAGRGNIANRFDNIHCIEKDELNSLFLSEKHSNVICNDFLFYNVKNESDKYDIIVMNPPYSNKQWKTHVEHALSLLKNDGVIYAILPQGKETEFKHCKKLKSFTNMFDNTQITTCLYKILK